jgi:hypothetical protein
MSRSVNVQVPLGSTTQATSPAVGMQPDYIAPATYSKDQLERQRQERDE